MNIQFPPGINLAGGTKPVFHSQYKTKYLKNTITKYLDPLPVFTPDFRGKKKALHCNICNIINIIIKYIGIDTVYGVFSQVGLLRMLHGTTNVRFNLENEAFNMLQK